jgi:rhamnosyltransferase
MNVNIAAVVVLYNPDSDVLDNINTYLNQVDKLFIIDNSDKSNAALINQNLYLSKIEYLHNKTNLGVATALNLAANKAIDQGFEYLLTMDQDSKAPPSMVSKLLDCFLIDSKIAIVSPNLQSPEGRNLIYESIAPYMQVFTAWTSGNLVDLKIYNISGGYRADFFIDYVDHEFCLRLNKMGYKIYTCYKTTLKHKLGRIEEKNLFFKKAYTTNHSALRLYYRTRNRFVVKNIYKKIFPDFFKQDDKTFRKIIIKVLLFENDKMKKLKYILRGYHDYRKNIFGKYEDARNL